MRKLIIFLIFTAVAGAKMDWPAMTLKVSSTNRDSIIPLLKEELYNLPYDSKLLVKDFLKKHPEQESALDKLIFKSPRMSQNYLTDGSIEYASQLSLIPKILNLLMPETEPVKFVVPMLCPCCGQPWPKGRPIPDGLQLIPQEITSTNYTGIIIDARGLGVKPCLFPRIYNESMNEVHSVNFAEIHNIIENGVVLYSRTELHNNSRIGNNPLRIEAIGVMGKNLSDIKISSSDARLIHGSKNNLKLLKECRVAIIIGP